MKIDLYEDLDKALKIIRNTCKQYERCDECPLRTVDNNRCSIIIATPNQWTLSTDESEGPVRLFR